MGAESRRSLTSVLSSPRIKCQLFGRLADGRVVDLYSLRNRHGVTVRVMTYGSTLVSAHVPDRAGRFDDVLLGFDGLEGYLAGHPYFGSTIGRYANRIAHGRFKLDGVAYRLAGNDGPNHLHGGDAGFDKRLWSAQPASDGAGVEMRYSSRDGEEGYPGNLDAGASYRLTDENELAISYCAATDRATIVNLTNHAYFNLAAHGDILDHEFEIWGDSFLPVDGTLIPTGELRAVEGSPMNFTRSSALRHRIAQNEPQLHVAGGYDHTWVLRQNRGHPAVAARVYEPASGRLLTVTTTQPGVQFYSGNRLDGSIIGKAGMRYQRHAGFCLEPHHFPDSPNRPGFPTTVLVPGETYEQTIIYRFDVSTG